MVDNLKQEDIYNPMADGLRSLDNSFTTVSLNSTPRRQSLDITDPQDDAYTDLYQFSSKECDSTQDRSDNIHKDSETHLNEVRVKKRICCFPRFHCFSQT